MLQSEDCKQKKGTSLARAFPQRRKTCASLGAPKGFYKFGNEQHLLLNEILYRKNGRHFFQYMTGLLKGLAVDFDFDVGLHATL